jgi:hypothetical protein
MNKCLFDTTCMARILRQIDDSLFWKSKLPKYLYLDQEEYEWALLYFDGDILTIGPHQIKLKRNPRCT